MGGDAAARAGAALLRDLPVPQRLLQLPPQRAPAAGGAVLGAGALRRRPADRPLRVPRRRRVGLVGDSLSENLAIALLCALRSADPNARRWKRRGAWRGGYFPRHDVTVAFHRAVLLAKYT